MMNLVKRLAAFGSLSVLALTLLAGCGGQPAATSSSASSASSSAAPQELHISAAASLTDAINELSELYKKDHPNVTITPSYGSSGALEKAIENGAPSDLFLSAGKKQMDDLEKAGEVAEGTHLDLLKNDLVLIAPSSSEAAKAVTSDKVTESEEPFKALTNADVRKIALGGDGVPVGSYSKEALESLHLTEAVQPKVVYATDVRQVLAWVTSGDCDRGLVYATDAKTTKDVTVLAAAPATSHRPVVYPAAVVKSAKEPELAKDFLTFLQSDAAQAVFAKYGFAKP